MPKLSQWVRPAALVSAASLALAGCTGGVEATGSTSGSSSSSAPTSATGGPTSITITQTSSAAEPTICTTEPPSSKPPDPKITSRIPVQELCTTGDTIEGSVLVNGHHLYVKCSGTGPLTVLYFHGWSPEVDDPIDYTDGIRTRLDGDYRFCAYDRRNVGPSDLVDAVQTPKQMMSDVDGVLKAVHAKPPYLVLGASYGGLVGYIWLNQHPKQVVGFVNLDGEFPDEMKLEHLLPRNERAKAGIHDDEYHSVERVAGYKVYMLANRYVGKEPAIPMSYLAASSGIWTSLGTKPPAYQRRIIPTLEGFVARFSPGVLTWVDSVHFMENKIPDQIAAAVRGVATQAGYGVGAGSS